MPTCLMIQAGGQDIRSDDMEFILGTMVGAALAIFIMCLLINGKEG